MYTNVYSKFFRSDRTNSTPSTISSKHLRIKPTFYTFFRKRVARQLLCIFLLLTTVFAVKAQVNRADWQLNPAKARNQTTVKGIPTNALHTTISISDFKQKLSLQQQEITLPNPDGEFETFVIQPTIVVAREVAHLYTIKTFRGYKRDDPTVLLAADISDNGFHASVFTAQHSYFIEPISNQPNQANQLAVYYKRDVKGEKLKCHADHTPKREVQPTAQQRNRAVAKRTFRLAVVATGEYGEQFGGTPFSATNTLNAMASGVNMINVVYLRDLGIEFTLVSNASMVFGDPDTDNIDVEDEDDISEKTYDIITGAIGENGFDVGHMVIWANLGGAAAPGVICDNFDKTEGYSGSDGSAVTLWVDYVAHEIGHQFNADHNFVSEECGTSVDGLRYEPGEGSSIMAYADVCGPPAQYAAGSDPYFHYASVETILNYLATIDDCGTTEPNGNPSDPVPNAQSDITIPKQTPFVLVGSATDANDPTGNLTFSWEQFDGSSEAISGPPNCNSTTAPLFRYRPPNNTGIRSFPQYTDVIAGNNDQQWEKLPCTARDINFSLTVRDNNPTFGRVAQDLMKITVADTGPFEVSSPNGGESITGNTMTNITWTVNGTDAHCSNVDILLSTDGGGTFTVIANATPNDGSESVTIPNNASTNARVLIQCAVGGSYGSASTFYDISNANFTIEAGSDIVDMDMDGIEADNDCDDNNANIGAKQMPGTTCDDGKTNTENDQIQGDSCTCAGTTVDPCASNGGDEDMDGFCADVDCDDNNPNIHPMATEIPDNGIDENCDGMDEVTVIMESCAVPSNPQVQILGPRKVRIDWSSVNEAKRYTLQIRFKGQTRWLVTARVRRNRVFVYGPTNRTYEYRIQSNCEGEDSAYSSIFEFSLNSNFTTKLAESRNSEEEQIDIDLTQYDEPTLALFPNPVIANLNIQLPQSESSRISIYHVSGKLVYEEAVNRSVSTVQLDVSYLQEGLYLIRIEIPNQQAISKRFIKR